MTRTFTQELMKNLSSKPNLVQPPPVIYNSIADTVPLTEYTPRGMSEYDITTSQTTLLSSNSLLTNSESAHTICHEQETELSNIFKSQNFSEYQRRYEEYKRAKQADEIKSQNNNINSQVDRISLYGIHVLSTEILRLSERIRKYSGATTSGDNCDVEMPFETSNPMLKGIVDNLYSIENQLRAAEANLSISHNFH